MYRTILVAALAFIPVTFIAVTASAHNNIEVKRSEVPFAALQTLDYYAPGLTITRFAYEYEDGQRIYEFTSTDAEGRHLEVDILGDGTLQEIEMEKSWDEVPVSVQIELALVSPEFEPTFIEASTRPDGSTVYEFEGAEKSAAVDYEVLDDGKAVRVLEGSG